MVAGGAAGASGLLSAPRLLATCMVAMLMGDLLVYYFGRRSGWWLLALLCKVSVNPETCILRSAETFYKRGRMTLVVAKFVPGLGTMAAPLAGSMKMRLGQFLLYDFAGTALYSITYTGIGFVFRDFLSLIVRGFYTAGRMVEIVVAVALIAYIAFRIYLYIKYRVYRVVPRITVELLEQRLESDGMDKFVIADVRSHGYYDAGAERIRGSIRLEPNQLSQALNGLPRDKDIYLYCT